MGQLRRMVHNQQPTPIKSEAWRTFRGCTRKKPYPTKAAAERAIRSIKRNGKDTNPARLLNTYQCEKCHAWHVGHSNKLATPRVRYRHSVEVQHSRTTTYAPDQEVK